MQKSTLVAMLIVIMHDSFITAEEKQDRDLLNRQMEGRQMMDRQMLGRQRDDRQMEDRQMMEREDRQLLERICKKCSYCDTDPGCIFLAYFSDCYKIQ